MSGKRITVKFNVHAFGEVYAGGAHVASIITCRRVRTICRTGSTRAVPASDLTPLRVRRTPELVVGYLELLGYDVDGASVEVFA